MTGPLMLLLGFSLATVVIGILWYRSDPVSAGYPGSFLVMMGIAGIGVTWWLL